MKQILKPLTKTFLSSMTTLLLASSLSADCTYQLFSISSVKGTQIGEFIDQLSDECSFTVIVTDPEAEKLLNKQLNKTHLRNLTVDEVLDLILKENNLFYKLENNILHISYLVTRTFDIDYIITTRKSVGTTSVTLSTSAASATGETGGGAGEESGGDSGIEIETTDEVSFWENLDLEFQSILNRPEDDYTANAPIINKTAGLVTVSATPKQVDRLDTYLKEMQRKAKSQVLIDVKLLSVTLDNKHETGIDWSQLYALQKLDIAAAAQTMRDITANTFDGSIASLDNTKNTANGHAVSITGTGSLNEVVKFLKTQGNVKAISNPKILTMNNQPAVISVGSEYFYKITSTTNTLGAGGNVGTTDDEVSSVFAGVLLDITPEIDDEGKITLKINPSLSETIVPITQGETARDVPPDLNRRQLSSVVTVQNGERVILGGLISSKDSIDDNKVPLLGDIPILGWLFKREVKINKIEELVIVIEPHIIKNGKQTVSLSELGYTGLNETQLESQAFIRSESQEDIEKLDAKTAELEAKAKKQNK